jgi:hypothetical protein
MAKSTKYLRKQRTMLGARFAGAQVFGGALQQYGGVAAVAKE